VSSTSETFEKLVSALLARYLRQNALAALSADESALIARRLWRLMQTRGLPCRLKPEEMGAPGEMSAEEVAPLVTSLLEGVSRAAELGVVARQLVKACFHPEFKKCRESYRETEDDGSCRRQMLERVRTRLSGSHCVDCPYWTALSAEQHQACLAEGWVGDATMLTEYRAIFLPEDFREFRRLLRASDCGPRVS